MNTKLQYGDYGRDVSKLQKTLEEQGWLNMNGATYGFFGEATLDAVNRYKDYYGLWNDGDQYRGVVGITTWEYMGMQPDALVEFGYYGGSDSFFTNGTYLQATGLSIKNGLVLGDVSAGITQIGGDYKYFYWEFGAVTGDAAAGLTLDFAGIDLRAALISAEGKIKIPIPHTGKAITLGAGGDLFGIGITSYIRNGEWKVGASALIGGYFSIGLEDY